MPLVLTLALTKFRQGLERKGVDPFDDQAVRKFIYGLLEKELNATPKQIESKPYEESGVITI